MLKNPDHKVIKKLARAMLFELNYCPDGLQKIANELLPIARFENGFRTPNAQRPTAVIVELDGQRWMFRRGKTNWLNLG